MWPSARMPFDKGPTLRHDRTGKDFGDFMLKGCISCIARAGVCIGLRFRPLSVNGSETRVEDLFVIRPTKNLRHPRPVTSHGTAATGLTRLFSQWTPAMNCSSRRRLSFIAMHGTQDTPRSSTASTTMCLLYPFKPPSVHRSFRQRSTARVCTLQSSHKLRISRFGCIGHWEAWSSSASEPVQNSWPPFEKSSVLSTERHR
jgi:hypothetical protein